MQEDTTNMPLEQSPKQEIQRNISVRPMEDVDIAAAAAIDREAFGEHGVTAAELKEFRDAHQDQCLVVVEGGNVVGFATFEVLDGQPPDGYEPKRVPEGKVAFIQQFTTRPNYALADQMVDTTLLRGVEERARRFGCQEVWEALDQNHKFSREQNPLHDAFGFYVNSGYIQDSQQPLVWMPGQVPCWLFAKTIS